ncbi:ATP-binding protein [Kineococcus sp. SYSU DK001]|uniref:ATP-binding protein n=1 Tax=Kineococcus sp. SYSU DK001 TaxID=3383122 RepID=UPI003D7D9B91
MSEATELVDVRLVGLPLPVRALFLQHTEELLRELTLIRLDVAHGSPGPRAPGPAPLPPRLLEIAVELTTDHAPFPVQPVAVAVAAAAAAGRDSCDVTCTLPRGTGSAVQRLARLLDEVDDFCRRETHLLTLPAPEEVVAYRRWVFGEFHRQLDGQPPRPWPRRPSAPGGDAGEDAGGDAGDRGAASTPGTAAGATPVTPAEGPGTVLGPPLVVEPLTSGVGAARRHVRDALRRLDGRTAEALEEPAELGVSELVSNAVLHARTSSVVTVRAMPSGRVRIEVGDSSPAPVQPRRFEAGATTGRGLRLVAALALDWGCDASPPERGPGKTVWFEPRPLDAGAALPADAGTGADWDLEGLL